MAGGIGKENMYLTKDKLKHGDRIKCKINEAVIGDAKVSINPSGCYYVVHNETEKRGSTPINMLGYRYGWSWDGNIKDVEYFEKTMDNLEVGDVLLFAADEDGDAAEERTVLGICGKVVFVSDDENPDEMGDGAENIMTIAELKTGSWSIKTLEEKIEVEGEKFTKKEIHEMIADYKKRAK